MLPHIYARSRTGYMILLIVIACIAQTAGVWSGQTNSSTSHHQPNTLTSKEPAATKQAGLPANRSTLGLLTGGLESTDLVIASEIASALVAGQEIGPHGERALRVLPMIGDAGRQNLSDLLTLGGVDLAIVPASMLDKQRQSNEIADIRNKLVYITPLFPEELHIIAGPAISDIRELAGKRVNLGEVGSASATLGRELLDLLGIRIDEVNLDLTSAIDAIHNQEIAATMILSGKPVRSLIGLMPACSCHFLAVPYSDNLQGDFARTALTHEDYPNLLDAGSSIDTVSTNSVLVAYNWPARGEHFHLLESLVSTLFSRLPEFQKPPHHPKWREVNLSARIASWSRFHPAERWLEQRPAFGAELRNEFETFLNQSGYGNAASLDLERIFQEFLRWLKRHPGS